VALVALACLLSSCSSGREEPGLFGRSSNPTTPAPTSSGPAPEPTVDLPVVGQAVWTSAEGLDLEVRIAVHAVRRMPGATVLDWSVTPLRAPGLTAGENVPPSVNLGLTRLGEDNANVLLLDGWAARVYRPLTSQGFGGLPSCLCSPVRLAERNLKIGQTQLLQIAFPPLPTDLPTVDVDIATVPIFAHVPVTAVGLVPTALQPVDLARGADVSSVGSSSPEFSYGRHGQRFLISVDEVVASSTFTSLRWTIQSLTSGPGLDETPAPPIAEAARTDRLYNPVSASGPQLRRPGPRARVLRALRVSVGPRKLRIVECLCSDLRVWPAALHGAEQEASLVTNFAPLPLGTDQVDVVLPGLKTLRAVDVTPASDGAFQSGGAEPERSRTWTSSADPPAGWSVEQWPTPLPDQQQLKGYRASVDTLVPVAESP